MWVPVLMLLKEKSERVLLFLNNVFSAQNYSADFRSHNVERHDPEGKRTMYSPHKKQTVNST